jgi:hypothetical protein
MKEKVSEIAGDLEGAIDDYILSKFAKIPSPYGVMHGRVKGKHAKLLYQSLREGEMNSKKFWIPMIKN